jgi:uncharacterized iron-regulated membrane protein
MNVWNKWLRQPQSILLRRILFQIHLWGGLVLALYILMISVTGSLLVYRREMATAVATAYVSPQARRLTPNELRAIVQRAYPGRAIENVSTPRIRAQVIPNMATAVELRRGSEIISRFFDPYTGADLGSTNPKMLGAIVWLADLHDDLLSQGTGRLVNGVGAICATLLTLTGAILWWPGIRNWRRSLTIDWKRRRFGLHWSLHNAVGFWMFLFVLLWGFSGIYLCFPKVFNEIVDFFEPLTNSTRQARVGDDILLWLAQLHFGRFSGLTVKAIWTVLGLVPAVLTVTGVMMWWHRVVRKESRRFEQLEAATVPARELQTSSSFGNKPSEAL